MCKTFFINITAGFLLLGCIRLGDEAIPRLSSSDLPGSRLTVCLYLGESEGEYFYGIFGNDSTVSCGTYSLGRVDAVDEMEPDVREIEPGVYRISWGSGEDAPYAVIDATSQQIIEDSNPTSEQNRRFTCE